MKWTLGLFSFLWCIPLYASEDPKWLYEDGFITLQESTELAKFAEDSVDDQAWQGNAGARISTRSDSSAKFQKPRWISRLNSKKFHMMASGDSSLRRVLIYGENDMGKLGAGHWTGSMLGLPWPNKASLGGWCVIKPHPIGFGIAASKDTSTVLAVDWKKRQRPHLQFAWSQNKDSHAALLQFERKEWRAWILYPFERDQYYSAMNGNIPLSSQSKIRWKAIRNHMDTSTKDLQSQLDLVTTFEEWVFSGGNRWTQFRDSLTSWILYTKAVHESPHSRLETSYSVRNEPTGEESHFYRIGSEWGEAPFGWRGLGIFQWELLSEMNWYRRPQLETGLKYVFLSQAFARFTLVTPRTFHKSQRTQFRGRIEGPCTESLSLEFHWTMPWYMERNPPISQVQFTLSLIMEL